MAYETTKLYLFLFLRQRLHRSSNIRQLSSRGASLPPSSSLPESVMPTAYPLPEAVPHRELFKGPRHWMLLCRPDRILASSPGLHPVPGGPPGREGPRDAALTSFPAAVSAAASSLHPAGPLRLRRTWKGWRGHRESGPTPLLPAHHCPSPRSGHCGRAAVWSWGD